jgi:hypothetical protein
MAMSTSIRAQLAGDRHVAGEPAGVSALHDATSAVAAMIKGAWRKAASMRHLRTIDAGAAQGA